MVVTPLMWKSLDTFDQLDSHIWISPLKWDSKRSKFVWISAPRKLVGWAIVLLYSSLTVTICSGLMLLQLYGIVQLSLLNFILTAAIDGILGFAVMQEGSSLLYGETLAAVANELKHLEWESRQRAIIFGHLLLNCVQNLIHSLSKWNNITGHLTPLVLMFYNIFAITLSILNDGISTIIALAMGLACVIEVCTIFLAIKGRAVVPAAIYPIFPSLGFAIPVVSYTLLGDAVNVGETTRRLKTACNNHIAMRKDTVGYMKRRIRAVKVAQLSGGIFSYTLFFLNKCTKAMFYWSMLYYTNVACLSISL
ncbi:hypothetical protein Fcan01_19216 [Folsomia candida]|uniref:Uncharacterized protein n=1 Tax=Folsomia candida TaxID=158441 RepID=A0A226DLE8_FOLCA|nr:hypothetical protein Fcan01_19216 [Folsomia candida]